MIFLALISIGFSDKNSSVFIVKFFAIKKFGTEEETSVTSLVYFS